MILVKFVQPSGAHFAQAELPAVPRIGDRVSPIGSAPRFVVTDVEWAFDPEGDEKPYVMVRLESEVGARLS